MITNLAAGIDDSSLVLTHSDVTGTAGEFAPQFTRFMLKFLMSVDTVPCRSVRSDLSLMKDVRLPQTRSPAATEELVKEAKEFLCTKVERSTLTLGMYLR